MAQQISILSGTRDALGGVDLAIANVRERPERPGVPSGLLLLAEDSRVIAAGDTVQLGGRSFRLDEIRPHRTGAHHFVFSEIVKDRPGVGPRPPYLEHPIPAVGPERLVRVLRAVTPALFAALGGLATGPAPSGWQLDCRESWTEEWNGEKLGPSTHFDHQALFAAPAGQRLEARIRHHVIRWNPQEVYRVEVAGSWLLGTAALSLFARGEGQARFETLSSSGLTEPMLSAIRAAILT